MSWYELKLDDDDLTPEHAKSVFTSPSSTKPEPDHVPATPFPNLQRNEDSLMVKLFTSKNSIKMMLLVFMVLFAILVALLLKHCRTS